MTTQKMTMSPGVRHASDNSSSPSWFNRHNRGTFGVTVVVNTAAEEDFTSPVNRLPRLLARFVQRLFEPPAPERTRPLVSRS
jgi:hypothetical protein